MATLKEIAKKIGGDYTTLLTDNLPAINEAMAAGKAEASLTVTLQLKVQKGGHVKALLKPRQRIPMDPIEYDLHVDDGQLEFGYPPESEAGEDDGGPLH